MRVASVLMHHRQEGRFLSQTQEELILIGAFGLLCLGTILLFVRTLRLWTTDFL